MKKLNQKEFLQHRGVFFASVYNKSIANVTNSLFGADLSETNKRVQLFTIFILAGVGLLVYNYIWIR